MMIDVTIGGETKRHPETAEVVIFTNDQLFLDMKYQVPYVEGGTQSRCLADTLTKKIIYINNEVERSAATEYWDGDNLRHRSVNIQLKKNPSLELEQGSFL